MSKKTIYLHIGFHKTGTSALQETFYENENALSEVGIYYPKTILGYPAHQELAWSLFDERPHWVDENIKLDSDEIYGWYIKLINASESDAIVLSSEDLCTLSWSLPKLEKIKNYFGDYNIKIICYVRDQIDFIQSLFHHAIKAKSYSKGFKAYLSDKIDLETGFFFQRLENWCKVFGRDNIIVKKYGEKEFYKGNIASDLLHAIDANDISLPSNKISNTGAHPWLVDVINNISNSTEINDELKDILIKNMLSISPDLPRVNAAKFYLDEIDYNLLKRFYLKQNLLLKREYKIDLL